MNDLISKLEERRKWLESLPDGIPCDHVGCLSHVSHPCEGCGRIGGRRLTPLAVDLAKPGADKTIKSYWKDGKLVAVCEIPPSH